MPKKTIKSLINHCLIQSHNGGASRCGLISLDFADLQCLSSYFTFIHECLHLEPGTALVGVHDSWFSDKLTSSFSSVVRVLLVEVVLLKMLEMLRCCFSESEL